MRHLLWLGLCLLACSSSSSNDQAAFAATAGPSLTEQLAQGHLQADSLWLRISKPDYELGLWHGQRRLKTYDVVFGADPMGDKQMQGDRRTPEGRFRIRAKYPHDKWTYFLWIDYPTEASWQKHRAAKAAGDIPATAQIGGEIGIHGVPQGYEHVIDQRQNWTLGCISLNSAGIKELYQLVPVGAEVVIVGEGE